MAWDLKSWEDLPKNRDSDLRRDTPIKIEDCIVDLGDKDLESVDFSKLNQSLGGGNCGMAKII